MASMSDLETNLRSLCLSKGHEYSGYLRKGSHGRHHFKYICGNCKEEGQSDQYSMKKCRGGCGNCSWQIANQTCLKKYGVKYPIQNEEIKERAKQTLLANYGVEHPMQSEEIRGKAKKTWLENYGVENPMQNEEVKEKSRQTLLANYGVEHPMQSEEVKERTRQTFLEKYGVENPAQSEAIKERMRQTCLEKYGVEYPFQNEEIKERGRQTLLTNYGVEYPFQNEEIRERARQTCLEKYGVENPFQSEQIKEKIRQICLEKYGVEHPMKSPEIFQKCIASSSRKKPFVVSGFLHNLMGWEPENITYLIHNDDFVLGRKIREEEFLFGEDIPTISYFYKGKTHEYHPDFSIKNTDVIVETKSTYTFNKEIERNLCKFKAVSALGKTLEVFIFKNRREIFDVLVFSPPNCFRSAIRGVDIREYENGIQEDCSDDAIVLEVMEELLSKVCDENDNHQS
jgi:hypothetical protein